MGLPRPLCFILMLLWTMNAWLINNVVAFRILPKAGSDSTSKRQHENEVEPDLMTLIQTPRSATHEVYSQAMSLLNSMQAAPSCNRLAASTLLNSCQSTEEPTTSTESFLEFVRSIYAAQLAMCEIMSAGSAVPVQCEPFKPGDTQPEWIGRSGTGARVRREHASPSDIASQQLGRCLQSLESRPQWWTSYSNSRQNAVVMCQAARVDIEKGNLLCSYSTSPLTPV